MDLAFGFTVFMLLVMTYLYFKVRDNNRHLSLDTTRELAKRDTQITMLRMDNAHWKGLFLASEEGVQEIVDNFENDALNLKEQIGALEIARDIHLADLLEKEKVIEHHAVHCHGIVEDTVELIMERLRPNHVEEALQEG